MDQYNPRSYYLPVWLIVDILLEAETMILAFGLAKRKTECECDADICRPGVCLHYLLFSVLQRGKPRCFLELSTEMFRVIVSAVGGD